MIEARLDGESVTLKLGRKKYSRWFMFTLNYPERVKGECMLTRGLYPSHGMRNMAAVPVTDSRTSVESDV